MKCQHCNENEAIVTSDDKPSLELCDDCWGQCAGCDRTLVWERITYSRYADESFCDDCLDYPGHPRLPSRDAVDGARELYMSEERKDRQMEDAREKAKGSTDDH